MFFFNRRRLASAASPAMRLLSLAWCLCLSTFSMIALTRHSDAQDWCGFHGLSLGGVVENGDLPTQWNDSDYRWRFDLTTRDVGSMAVKDGNVYLLSSSKDKTQLRLIAIDLDSGSEKWTLSFPHSENHLHKRNTLASSTPAVDEDHVYIAHSDRDRTWVRCIDVAGTEVWSRDLGPAQSQHGFGTSPVIEGDRLILNFSQQAEQVRNGKPGVSRIYAFDRLSGETLWETPVTSRRVCYGKPYVHDGKVICANTGDGVFALSLEDGKMLWRNPVFRMRCVSSPIIAGELAIGTSGSGGGGNHLVAVRMPKEPNQTPQEVYRIESAAPYVPTSVVRDGAMYVIDDGGVATCVDVQSGDLQWKKRIGGNFGASPILVGDKCLLVSLDGTATLIRASREFEKLGSVDLGGPVGATPAFANGRLLLRVGTELLCL